MKINKEIIAKLKSPEFIYYSISLNELRLFPLKDYNFMGDWVFRGEL